MFQDKNMILKHFAQLKRKFLLCPQIDTVGYMANKQERMNKSFLGCNFSFILSGQGYYMLNGEKITFKAPCVLLQWPNVIMDYAPTIIDGKGWEEVFFIYPASEYEKLTQSNTFNIPNGAVRCIELSANFSLLMKRVLETIDNLNSSEQISNFDIDDFDVLCWRTIVASFDDEYNSILNDPILKQIIQYLERDFSEELMLNNLAKKLNMSLSTLRRFWQKHHPNETFNDYRNHMFIQKSSQLLVETSYDIKKISELLGFNDAHYFSRKFHQLVGITATDYRKQHQEI